MSFQNCKIVGRNMDSTVYHAAVTVDRGDPAFPMSPSALKLFAPCHKKWRAGFQPKGTKAQHWGSLVDCLVLTPDQFKASYAVVPKDAPRRPTDRQREARKPSSETLSAIAWWDDFSAENKDKIMLDEEGHELASAAILTLMKDDTVKRYLEASNRQVWVAGEWNDNATGLVIPVRCLIDLEPNAESEFGKSLGDLKQTRSAALFPFLSDSFKFGHHIQAAFDLDLYRAALPEEDRCMWCLIIQENTEPWTVGRRMMTDDPSQPDNLLDLGRVTYQRLLRNYCICLKTGKWPDYEEMAAMDKDLSNYVIQGWFAMTAKPFMMDYLPSTFELPVEEGDSDEPEPSDVPH